MLGPWLPQTGDPGEAGDLIQSLLLPSQQSCPTAPGRQPRSSPGLHHLLKPHRIFPEERDGPSPLSELWKEASPRAPPIPLFCFPFHLPSDPYLLQAGVSSPALGIKLCKSLCVLILRAVSTLTSQQPRTAHTTLTDPFCTSRTNGCLPEGSVALPSSQQALGPLCSRQQLSQGPKGPSGFFWNFFILAYTSSPGPGEQVKLCDPTNLCQLQSVLRYVAKASHSESQEQSHGFHICYNTLILPRQGQNGMFLNSHSRLWQGWASGLGVSGAPVCRRPVNLLLWQLRDQKPPSSSSPALLSLPAERTSALDIPHTREGETPEPQTSRKEVPLWRPANTCAFPKEQSASALEGMPVQPGIRAGRWGFGVGCRHGNYPAPQGRETLVQRMRYNPNPKNTSTVHTPVPGHCGDRPESPRMDHSSI